MTTLSDGGREVLARAHGAHLHRLAALLTGDSQDATRLTAEVLAGAPDVPEGPGTGDRLERDLVRRFVRTSRRRRDALLPPGGDAGDVLRRLAPRARAAAVLLRAERWDPERAADAVGVSRGRLERLVPDVPGLELALAAQGDQHALAGSDLQAALAAELETRTAAPARRRPRLLQVAAVALPVALLLGYAVQAGQDEEPPGEPGTSLPVALGADLTAAGWRLDDEGEPPRTVMGLALQASVALEAGSRTMDVSVPAASADTQAVASYGVLWCDMPPAEDDHLQVPVGRITLDGVEVELPCAGLDGTPPVSRVAALPEGAKGTLRVEGDLPGGGTALLGLYREVDPFTAPLPLGTATDAPAVPDGAAVIDVADALGSIYGGLRTAHPVSVGSDSVIRVWAGRAGQVGVTVDGLPATDDGDMAGIVAMFAELTPGQIDGTEPVFTDPRDYQDWSTQQPDLRDGRWLVPAPGSLRTFDIPEPARPPAGERRTVVVEVTTDLTDVPLQVAVLDAHVPDLALDPVTADDAPTAPGMVLGHRLVGQWEVPGDGLLRELALPDGREVPEGTLVLLFRDIREIRESQGWISWGEGRAVRDEQAVPLWPEAGLEDALRALRHVWTPSLPGVGPVSVAAPPAQGHPPTTVLAYAPVPYEDFDFAAAPIPPDLRPAGEPASVADEWPGSGRVTAQDRATEENLVDGRVTLTATGTPWFGARVTAEGRGRMRFLVDGMPADALTGTEGWWSTWTDEPVTGELELGFGWTGVGREVEVTVVVEDYEEFSIELLTE